ncbi:MAG: BamA/TamA family outer membrane protein [Flavobacteriales bacterium]|nr:BamA/TamA family outer membrane protein [Flavobacteriales bacterium]
MIKLIFTFIILIFYFNSFAQEANVITYRVINIGNTVDIENRFEYFSALKNILSKSNDPVLLILNGDLIERNKLDYLGADSLKVFKMLKLLSSVKNAKIIVIPGDRDWNNSKKGGLKKVKQLEKLVEYDRFSNVKWILDNGCPGPKLIELDSTLMLMAINTQWWNHPYDKPTSVDGQCDINTKKDFIIEFENILSESEEKNLIIVGHFPLIEQGTPAFKDYLLPFPLAGSFITSFHQNIGGTKDIVNERFDFIRKKMLKRISVKNGIIYLSGHEFNTQIIKENENYFINNGLPSYQNKTRKVKASLYSNITPSITELVYYANGNIVSFTYNYKNSNFQINKEIILHNSLKNIEQYIIPKDSFLKAQKKHSNKSFLKDVSAKSYPKNENFVNTNAGNYKASGFRKLLIGKHYRKTWNALIEVPILDMDTTKGGLNAYAKGGGHQTTSVKMYGKDGYAYTFRSVNKDATRDLDKNLVLSLVARQMQDNVSMQYPYGSLVVSKLLDYTSILHAQSTLYVLPKSNRLGSFKHYIGLFGTLEDHQKNPKKVKNSFANADKILQSHKLNKRLYEDYNHKINAEEYTQARVFDILIGDHGKHQDNWKWAGYKSDSGTIYRAIPRDRDLVFIKWDGVVPWIMDRKWGQESGENFGYKINDVKSLMWVARHQDRFLTNEMDKQDWINASHYIQSQLTDSIIEEASKTLPSEIYTLSGKIIEDKLKTRIKELDNYAIEYYNLLAKQVDVVGSNKNEYFEVMRNADATVDVLIYNILENSDTLKGEQLIYHRKFIPKETKEIRLYGLGGKDVFHIYGRTKKSIPIIIIGGNGDDIVSDYSVVKTPGKQTKIYENTQESLINTGSEAKIINTWNTDLYEFQPAVFEYNRYMPLFSINYSSDNGFGTGIGVTFTKKEKFGNVGYSAKHKFSLDASTEQNNIFNYQSRYRHIIRRWDVQIGALFANHHDFTNFFGLGNNTIKNDSLLAIDFYKTTYNSYSANLGLVREFWKKSSFSVNVEFQHNAAQLDENTIVYSSPEINSSIVFGTSDNNIFITTTQLEIDFRDKKNLPEQGIHVYGYYKAGIIPSNNSSTYNMVSGVIEHYFTAYIPSPITLGLRGGGSISDGEIPFYNLIYLGNGNNLRGFKKNRFTGNSTVFVNTELRIQLANFSSAFVPIKFGVIGFYDTGRIYSDFDIYDKWHNGFGGGIYWVLLNESFTFNLSIAHSEEESNLFLFSLGKAFN